MVGFLRPRKGLYSLPPLKEESRQQVVFTVLGFMIYSSILRCLRNLASYKKPRKHTRSPSLRHAAVLVALFVGRSGDLHVLLSRRAETLRTYAGDTALPGGKAEPSDRSMEDTARREAFEEIGLTMDKRKVPLLCVLEPFIARDELLVTPVVVLVLDTTIRPVLNAPEVRALFSHPLMGFLSESPPPNAHVVSSQASEATVTTTDECSTEKQKHYYTFVDVPWKHDDSRPIRSHSFLTGREFEGVKPVYGLTASILIRVATIGYARQPDFDVDVPNQPGMRERIDLALLDQQRDISGPKDSDESASRLRKKQSAGDEKDARPRRVKGRL